MCPLSNYQFLHFNINFKDHFIILCIVSFKSKLNGRVMVVPSLSQLLTCGFKSWVLQKMSQSLRTKILRFCNIILSNIWILFPNPNKFHKRKIFFLKKREKNKVQIHIISFTSKLSLQDNFFSFIVRIFLSYHSPISSNFS